MPSYMTKVKIALKLNFSCKQKEKIDTLKLKWIKVMKGTVHKRRNIIKQQAFENVVDLAINRKCKF